LVTFVIWGRLFQVQVLQHDFYKSKARRQWTFTRKIPPERGDIFDRDGRPLALNSHSYSVAVIGKQVRGTRKLLSSLSSALGVSGKVLRSKLKKRGFVWLARRVQLSRTQRQRLKKIPGVMVYKEGDRIYPFGSVAAKLVGFVGLENKGMAGIEAAFDKDLRGAPGWEKMLRDANSRAHDYFKYPKRDPEDGHHVVLTIDVRIQEIAEADLAEAVRENGAKWGAVILMDCRTGEILALAEYPSPSRRRDSPDPDSLWTLRSISCVYEPGSTFKLVTAAALLDRHLVEPGEVFDAGRGEMDLGFAEISDAHPYGELSFEDAFVYSSNIVMAQACRRLSPLEFYKAVRIFGFGAKTGIELLGESPGRVAPVEEWSRRTQVTMAFGQEIAVTPLQMAAAFAAIANDGVMMAPSIVRAVVDRKFRMVKEFKPMAVRRVVSRETARILRTFCRRVVEEGTGKAAAAGFLAVAGKTGTGQKALPTRGYQWDKFVASFAGFFPAEDPKLVCLVLLDEPRYSRRFGGVSAAPLFAEIVADLVRSSDILGGSLVQEVVKAGELGAGLVPTPNFVRLPLREAMERARERGIAVMAPEGDGVVVAQEPGPGAAMLKDTVVRLRLSSSALGSEHASASVQPSSSGGSPGTRSHDGISAGKGRAGVPRWDRPRPPGTLPGGRAAGAR